MHPIRSVMGKRSMSNEESEDGSSDQSGQSSLFGALRSLFTRKNVKPSASEAIASRVTLNEPRVTAFRLPTLGDLSKVVTTPSGYSVGLFRGRWFVFNRKGHRLRKDFLRYEDAIEFANSFSLPPEETPADGPSQDEPSLDDRPTNPLTP